MIKAQDLRIGNLLIDVEDRICKVERIYEDDWTAYAIKGTVTTGTPYPITLTEEILLKFGFEKSIELMSIKLDFEYIFLLKISKAGTVYIKQGHDEVVIKSNVIYLHQLQNLYFALCGQELNTSGL